MYIYAVIIIHNGRFRFLSSMCRLSITVWVRVGIWVRVMVRVMVSVTVMVRVSKVLGLGLVWGQD